MTPLEPPDTHHVAAAHGWLGLGSPAEAEVELGKISPDAREHPDVLEAHWLVCASQQRWDHGLQIARKLLQADPGRPSGWLHQAYALRRVPGGDTSQAWEALLPAYERFPDEAIIPYNLSCYACQLQKLDAARQWLKKAVRVAGREEIKRLALSDTDLQPLWEEIRNL